MKALILDGSGVRVRSTSNLADVEDARDRGSVFWLELDERTPEVEAFLETKLKIHPLTIEDIWADVGLPKVEDFAEYVQVIVHGIREVDHTSKEIPLELSELDLVIGKTFLVTHAHDEKVCAVAPLQEEVLRNSRLLEKGPAFVAHAPMSGPVRSPSAPVETSQFAR